MAPAHSQAPWPKEGVAGLVAAIVTLAPVLTLGVLATAALGGNAAAVGIPAAFASVALGGMVVALFGRSALPASGLSSATVVIYAAMVATLAADAAADATSIFACMALVVFAMGVMQVAFAWLRPGSLAKFVPHPVLSGFMNAVALLILMAQVPLLLGIEPRAWSSGAAGWRDAQPATLAVALGTALLIGGIAWRRPRAPADHWTRRLLLRLWRGERHRSLLLNLGVVALVCGLTLWQGFVIGVAVGVVASLGLFIHAMNRSLVRERYDASLRPSRRLYPAQQEQLLAPRRRRIEVMVLEGALFFGSVERLASQVDGLPPHTASLVLDLRRITTIDGSGAVALLQLGDELARRGIRLLLAGVAANNTHGRVLHAAGAPGDAAAQWWPDADLAIEAAEAALIEHGEPATRLGEWPLAACSLFEGLSPAQAGALGAGMTRMPLSDGTLLFRAGDAADSLFVLTQGSISIVQLGHDDRTAQRYVSLSPGMMFGETAMLDGAGRSAAARADGESVVHELTQRDLDALSRADPALGVRVYRNIGRHLSQRLRSAAVAWRDAR